MRSNGVPVHVWPSIVEKPFANLQLDSLQSKPRTAGSFLALSFFFALESETSPVKRIHLHSAIFAGLALATLLLPSHINAQEPGNLPETKAPAPTQTPVVQKAPAYDAKLDWPWLARFKEADLKLAPPAPGENRVVFMGDSITEGWHFDGPKGFFPGKPYINRGISGQTTPQMVLRFRQDVIALQPKVVVILAGINDIAGNTGPETLEQIEDNLASMAELATANHIRVVLCSVMPAFDFPWRPGLAPAAKVVALNEWIKGYAAAKSYVYVDFHTAMKDDRDGLPAKLSGDGVHPNPTGYAIMTPLVEAGIAKALAQ
jgi:lysophospholipase L1-like esterase